MDRSETKAQGTTLHSFTLADRNKGSLEGVTKVVSASPENISLITSRGGLVISGKELKIMKYDADTGKLSFEGEVCAVKYEGGKKPLLKRLFK